MERKSKHLVIVNPRAKNSREDFVKAIRRAQRSARRDYEAEKARESE